MQMYKICLDEMSSEDIINADNALCGGRDDKLFDVLFDISDYYDIFYDIYEEAMEELEEQPDDIVAFYLPDDWNSPKICFYDREELEEVVVNHLQGQLDIYGAYRYYLKKDHLVDEDAAKEAESYGFIVKPAEVEVTEEDFHYDEMMYSALHTRLLRNARRYSGGWWSYKRVEKYMTNNRLRNVAIILDDRGWRPEDKDDMVSECQLTIDEVEAVIDYMESHEWR